MPGAVVFPCCLQALPVQFPRLLQPLNLRVVDAAHPVQHILDPVENPAYKTGVLLGQLLRVLQRREQDVPSSLGGQFLVDLGVIQVLAVAGTQVALGGKSVKVRNNTSQLQYDWEI